MNSGFLKRFFAFIIDVLLISIISSILTSGIETSDKYDDLVDKNENLITKYYEQEITIDEYIKQMDNLNYDLDKESYIKNIIILVTYISYYIIFQYLNNGQTIGKRLFKIRIKPIDGKLKPNQIVIRALIINSIFSSIILLGTINLLNKENYLMLKTIITGVETLFIIVSAIMILYRKDKRGLQDIITKTEVVKEGV